MEKEINLNDSLNKYKEGNDFLLEKEKESEINEKSKMHNSDKDFNKFNIEYNTKSLRNNYTSIKYKNEILKKINNKKVNNTLNDIYNSIVNLNEVNARVKNILSKRKLISKSSDIKRKMIKEENDSSIGESMMHKKRYNNYSSNIKNNTTLPKTSKNSFVYNINKDYKSIDFISTFRTSKKNNNSNYISTNKKISKNNSYNINNINNYSIIPKNESYINKYEYPKPTYNKEIKVIFKHEIGRAINNKINNDFEKNEKIPINYLNESESILKCNEINNNDFSSIYYNEEINNEIDVKNMKINLKKEEKKLKNLEEEKHKLLKEEKKRRKLLMEKIKKKNKIKKQKIISEYKKKINIIKILQEQNINEIIQLKKNKKSDEGKIIQINNFINDDEEINKKILKIKKNKRKLKKRQNSIKDKKLNSENYEFYKSEKGKEMSKYYNESNNCYTFGNSYYNIEDSNIDKDIHNKNNDESTLIQDYKYINHLYELTKSYNQNNKEKSKSFSYKTKEFDNISNTKNYIIPKQLNNNFDLYIANWNKKSHNNNFNDTNNERKNDILSNITNNEDTKSSLEYYINNQNSQINRKYKNYNSDSRKCDKKTVDNNINLKLLKKYTSPRIEMPSFIKKRVNKYNHCSNRKSSISKRNSIHQITPYSLNYNFNNKFNNYNIPLNISKRSTSNCSEKNNKTESKRSDISYRKRKELNYKTLFFNNE